MCMFKQQNAHTRQLWPMGSQVTVVYLLLSYLFSFSTVSSTNTFLCLLCGGCCVRCQFHWWNMSIYYCGDLNKYMCSKMRSNRHFDFFKLVCCGERQTFALWPNAVHVEPSHTCGSPEVKPGRGCRRQSKAAGESLHRTTKVQKAHTRYGVVHISTWRNISGLGTRKGGW